MKLAAIAVVFLAAILNGVRADDWPQWRGSLRDGVWRETGIVDTIPAAGLTIRWQAKVGQGYSAPSVAGGRVFVTDHVFDPELERVVCFDEKTGNLLWTHRYTTDYKDMEYGNGPRAAPTVHDGKVYTLGTQGHLFCLDALTGKVVWQKELVKDFDAKNPRYGVSAAPLIAGELLIVCAGGQPDASVVALDRKTGELRWKALEDRAAYSAPVMVHAGGCDQLIVWTADSITGFDPPSGKVYWQVPWRATFDPAQMVATPVRHDDQLFFMGAWNRGSKMLQLDPAKPAASVLWETRKEPTTTTTTPLFQDDGYIYAVLGDGSLACLNASTGDKVWSTTEPTNKRGGSAHLTRNGDRVFLFNDTGHLILARLTPKGYEEHGRCLLVEPTAGYRAQGPLTWAHPAYANKCIFARNDRELVCASLAVEGNVRVASSPAPSREFRVPAGLPGGSESLAYSPDGKVLAASGTWLDGMRIVELASGRQLPVPPPLRDALCVVAYSPDGKLLVTAGGSEFTPARNGGKTTGQIKVFDVAAGKELGELAGHTNKVFAAAFSPDSRTLATGGADNTVRLWDATARKERLVLEGHIGAVMSVAFSPDGRRLVSAGADRTARVWDEASGKPLDVIEGHEDEIHAAAFSPDGKTIATGSADLTVRLWDAGTRQPRAVLRGHRGSINTLAFSPDGKILASGSGDETIKLWDAAGAKELHTLGGHRGSVSTLAFSPDGLTLASAGLDDPVRLWDLTKVRAGAVVEPGGNSQAFMRERWRAPLELHSPTNVVVGRIGREARFCVQGTHCEASRRAAGIEVFDELGKRLWQAQHGAPDLDFLPGAYVQWISGPDLAEPAILYSFVPGMDGKLGGARLVRARDGGLLNEIVNTSRFGNNNSVVTDLRGDGHTKLLYPDLQSLTCYTLPSMEREWHWDQGVKFCWSLPSLVDVDRDGQQDIVFGSEYNNANGTSSVIVLDGSGRQIWRSDGHAEDLGSTPVFAADVDGDGTQELLKVGLDLEHRQKQEWNHLHVFDLAGKLKRKIALGFTGIAIGDMDGDGHLDGVGLSNTRDGGSNGRSEIRCLDLATGELIWATPVPRAYLDTNSPVMAGFTGDGKLCAVVGTGNPAGYARLPKSEPWGDLYVVDHAGHIAQHESLPGWPVNLAFCDLDDDGRGELMAVIDGKPGALAVYDTPACTARKDWPTPFGDAARTGTMVVRRPAP